MLPGLVGLGILDAFALDLPVITTDYEFHSPEFSYISDGENGRVTENSQSAYSAAIVECLLNEEYMAKLKSGCQKTARIYSIENMAKNFSQGVMRCLAE